MLTRKKSQMLHMESERAFMEEFIDDGTEEECEEDEEEDGDMSMVSVETMGAIMDDTQWQNQLDRFQTSLATICERYGALQSPEFGATWAKVTGPRGNVQLHLSGIDRGTLVVCVDSHRLALSPTPSGCVVAYDDDGVCYVNTTLFLTQIVKKTNSNHLLTPTQVNKWRERCEDQWFFCEVTLDKHGRRKFMLLEHMAVFLSELPKRYTFWYCT